MSSDPSVVPPPSSAPPAPLCPFHMEDLREIKLNIVSIMRENALILAELQDLKRLSSGKRSYDGSDKAEFIKYVDQQLAEHKQVVKKVGEEIERAEKVLKRVEEEPAPDAPSDAPMPPVQ